MLLSYHVEEQTQTKKSTLKSEKTFLYNQLNSTLNQLSHRWRWNAVWRTELWQREQEKRNNEQLEPPVKTVSHWHTNQKYINTLMYNMKPFNELAHTY